MCGQGGAAWQGGGVLSKSVLLIFNSLQPDIYNTTNYKNDDFLIIILIIII